MAKPSRGLSIAASAARQSNRKQFRVGAALVRKKLVIRTGRNAAKTHPKSKTRFREIHAEFDCLIGLSPLDCQGATLYVVRIRRNGSWGMAKPCGFCRELAINMGIRKVCYTNNLGEIKWERL